MSIEKIQTFTTIYFCMSANNSKPDISKIKDFDIKKIRQELHQFMRNSEKLDPYIIKEDACMFLEEIFAFNKPQQKFIDIFFNEKKILAELIEINETKLTRHPALLHKIQKIK